MDTLEEETSETKDGEVSDESRTDVSRHAEASGMKMHWPLWRSALVCKEPKRFSVSVMAKTFTADESSLKEALAGVDKVA